MPPVEALEVLCHGRVSRLLSLLLFLTVPAADYGLSGPFLPNSQRRPRSHPPSFVFTADPGRAEWSSAPAAGPVKEVVRPAGHLEPACLLSSLHELSWGTASLPHAPSLIVDGDWLKSVLSSSSGDGPARGRIPGEVRPAIAGAPAPSPSLEGGMPPQGPPNTPVVEGDAEDMLRHAWERHALRQESLRGRRMR